MIDIRAVPLEHSFGSDSYSLVPAVENDSGFLTSDLEAAIRAVAGSVVQVLKQGVVRFQLGTLGVLCWPEGRVITSYGDQIVPLPGIAVACLRGTEEATRTLINELRAHLCLPPLEE